MSGAGSTIVHSYTATGSYTATLRVVDSGGAEAFHSMTIIVSDAPVPTPLAAPTSLQASVRFRRVPLKWSDNAGNETAYLVERATGESSFVEIARLPANTATYTDSHRSGGTYRYRVRAATDDQVSAYSNVVQVRVR